MSKYEEWFRKIGGLNSQNSSAIMPNDIPTGSSRLDDPELPNASNAAGHIDKSSGGDVSPSFVPRPSEALG